ncbi:TrkA family potassium uptake protein [Methanosphaera cuniculi]|uniref:potassium channel family protein n=1 Tax=Methanosphaera cuniculi TaxID=1077256 RepID=UPI0026F2F346|nr:TrkA family potassium uptake protein [Methanosphaera cuniculi]
MNGIIVGAGRIGYNLATKLQTDHDITIIDKDIDAYDRASEQLNCYVVHGNGTNTSILEKEDIDKVDFFVAATGNDEVNLLCSVFAKEHDVTTIVSKLNNPDHASIFKKLGISVINPERSIVRYIARMIVRPTAQSLVTIGKGDGEILEVKVKNRSIAGKTIKQIENNTDKFIIISKYIENDIIIPNNETILNYDDSVAVLIKRGHLLEIRDYFTEDGFEL